MGKRFSLTREQQTSADWSELYRDDSKGLLVIASPCGLLVKAFAGRASKPDFYFRFAMPEKAVNHVNEWLKQRQDMEARKCVWRGRTA